MTLSARRHGTWFLSRVADRADTLDALLSMAALTGVLDLPSATDLVSASGLDVSDPHTGDLIIELAGRPGGLDVEVLGILMYGDRNPAVSADAMVDYAYLLGEKVAVVRFTLFSVSGETAVVPASSVCDPAAVAAAFA